MNHHLKKRVRSKPRRGAALLMCLFTLFVVSSFVLNMFSTETLQLASTRNTIEYEQALYQANAGIHHACVQLMSDSTWRGSLTDGSIPPATNLFGYEVTASDSGSNVLVQATGYSGQGKRTLEAIIQL